MIFRGSEIQDALVWETMEHTVLNTLGRVGILMVVIRVVYHCATTRMINCDDHTGYCQPACWCSVLRVCVCVNASVAQLGGIRCGNHRSSWGSDT